jgi:hypothetical protein
MAGSSNRVYAGIMANDLRTVSKAGANPLAPSLMSPAERRAELCAILAIGLMRLRLRQSSELSAGMENSLVDFPPDQSGHATASDRRVA